MAKDDVASPADAAERWTSADQYLGALARRRSFRRGREPAQRTEPEAPRFLLSTLPFLALFAALAVITVGIVLAAFPGSQRPRPEAKAATAAPELGTARKGWFAEAQREMKRQPVGRR